MNIEHIINRYTMCCIKCYVLFLYIHILYVNTDEMLHIRSIMLLADRVTVHRVLYYYSRLGIYTANRQTNQPTTTYHRIIYNFLLSFCRIGNICFIQFSLFPISGHICVAIISLFVFFLIDCYIK